MTKYSGRSQTLAVVGGTGWRGGSYVQCLTEEMTGHWGEEHYNRKFSLNLIHKNSYK